MKVMSYNIQYGKGMDGRYDLVRACRVVRGADIICLQEVDQYWKRSGDIDQAAEIAGLLPTYYYVYGSSFDVDASASAAHGAVINRRRRHGNMILSRWPILSCRSFNLPKQYYDDKFNMHMTFLETVIACETGPLRVYNYHAGYLESAERIEQVRYFAAVFNRAVGEHGAWSGKADIDGVDWDDGRVTPPMPTAAIVCGDFNANVETEEFGLLLDSTGLEDSWALVDPERANHPTWKNQRGEDVRMWGKIDHILATPELASRLTRVAIDDDVEASDHKPIQADFDLS